jgi:hypothetical protein
MSELSDDFKYQPVSRSKVCSSISEGGLGVQKFVGVQLHPLRETAMVLWA